MHHSLRVLGWAHRKGLLPRLDLFTTPLLWAAELVKGFGSDQGGMVVRVAGRDTDGKAVTRGWRLHMGQGQGPFVPAVPTLLVIRRIIAGDMPPGARPAMAEFTLEEAEAVLAGLNAVRRGAGDAGGRAWGQAGRRPFSVPAGAAENARIRAHGARGRDGSLDPRF